MNLQIPNADPPISEGEIAFLRDDVVGDAPPDAELVHLAMAINAHCLLMFCDKVLEQGGMVLAQQATDFGHRIWCYHQIAFQLYVERVAMDFPEDDPNEIMNILVRRSRELEYGD
jgi:hypothetical protein